MSGIEPTSTTNSTAPNEADAGVERLDLPFPPTADVGKFVMQHVPVLRRPPALRFAKPIDLHNAALNAVIGSHLTRLTQKESNAFAFDLAEMVVRLGPKLADGAAGPEVLAALEMVSETVLMYEHLYLAQSGAGGQ